LQTETDSLNSILNELYEWSLKLQISISVTYNTFSIVYVGNIDSKLSMSLNSNNVPVVNEVKDLGVVADTHLTFHSHIAKNVVLVFISSNLILNVLFHVTSLT